MAEQNTDSSEWSNNLRPEQEPIQTKKPKSSTRKKRVADARASRQAIQDIFRSPSAQLGPREPANLDTPHEQAGRNASASPFSASGVEPAVHDTTTPPFDPSFAVEVPLHSGPQPEQHVPEDEEMTDPQPAWGDDEMATAASPDETADLVPQKGSDFSNEARVYHARYDYLSRLHDEGRFYECKQGCFDLLTEPSLPRYTTIQVLQMVSTILEPPAAEKCLLDAAQILGNMDSEKIQVQLLKQDNDSMLADLMTWRQKKGLVGKDLEEAMMEDGYVANPNDGPVDQYFRLDRDLHDAIEEEREEEMEHVGYKGTFSTTRDQLEAGRALGLRSPDPDTSEETTEAGLPSPKEEETDPPLLFNENESEDEVEVEDEDEEM